MEKAGLNPGLLYGMGGAGGGTTGGASAMPSGQQGDKIFDMQQIAQLRLLEAQAKNIDADTANKQAGTGNTEAKTVNETLNSVILKYAGQEAAAQWKIKKENRLVESETYGAELEARQAVAKTVYENWVNGTLEKMSAEQLRALVLSNAKSEQERKNLERAFEMQGEQITGQKLNNAILELEKTLQTKTGLDRNSDGWLKMIGRLLIGMGIIK